MSDRSPTNPMLVTHAFSNGTEGHAWTSTWCDYCVHDHGQHMKNWSDGCELVLNSLVHDSTTVGYGPWSAGPGSTLLVEQGGSPDTVVGPLGPVEHLSQCSAEAGQKSGQPLNPEAWVAEPDDGQFFLPSRMICLRFKPCYEDGCEGDPVEQDRALRVDQVQAYWRERATS